MLITDIFKKTRYIFKIQETNYVLLSEYISIGSEKSVKYDNFPNIFIRDSKHPKFCYDVNLYQIYQFQIKSSIFKMILNICFEFVT